MRSKQISQLPIVDEENRIVSLETISDLLMKNKKDNFVVLMAGGMGKRLSPMTDSLPKPLLKVGNKPILEIILDNFISHGFQNFYVSVNYKAELIKNHFQDGSKYGVNIQYIEEDQVLGTAGALKLLKEHTDLPIIVMNGDLLTNVSFTNLLEFHKDQNAIATMCVREFDLQVPYGVVCLENDQIKTIDEKPSHKFFINAGIYVLNPEIRSMIPNSQQFDMPQLFNSLRTENYKTIAFPIREYWLDIGKKDDFDKANVDFSEVFK
jgi:NDP-sugar pyrophosphorylase family protein